MGTYSITDTLLLIAAAFVAAGGVLAIVLARRHGKGSPLPAPGLHRLSGPTHAVLGVALCVAAYHLAAPVFGWSGWHGPMGAIAALAAVSVVGSIALDLMQRRDESDGDES